jgi:uncharacterized membrane protein YbhN (UPF0104 family)
MPETADASPRTGLLSRVLGSIWLRIVVTSGLLAVVAANVDWSRMEDRVANGRPGYFVAAVLLVIATLGVGVIRWRVLLAAADVHLDTASLTRVYAVSTFSSTFLPTSVGGDVARALLVVRRGPLLTRVGVSVAVDRLGGFIGLLGVAWIALAIDPGAAPGNVVAFLAWVSLAFVAGAAIGGWVALRGRAVQRLVPWRLRALASHSRALLRTYAADRRLLVSLVLTSLVFQALVALSIVALARSIDVSLSYSVAALTLTLMTVATMVPLSVAGFGVREASYVVILGPAGISTTDATLISLLTVAALFVASLPGAFLLIRRGTTPVLEAAA